MNSAQLIASPLRLSAIVSLLVFSFQTTDGQAQGAYAIACPARPGEEEYYDGVVEHCQKCEAICKPFSPPPYFCFVNCPEYYRRLLWQQEQASKTGHEHATLSARSLVAETPLLQHPLLWLSVGCMTVAILATVASVVLLVVCRRSRALNDVRLLASNGSSPAYSRSTSETSTPPAAAQEKKALMMGPDVTSAGDFQA